MMNYNQLSNAYKSSTNVRRVKRWLLFVVLLLIVVDVVAFLTLKNNLMPTVSREVLQSVPLFSFFIWVAGIVTVVMFFPSLRMSSNEYGTLKKSITILLIISMFVGGYFLRDLGLDKSCGSLKINEVSSIVQPFVKVECILTAKENYREINCSPHSGLEQCVTKFNLTVPMKIVLFLLGALWGALVWPRRHQQI